MVRSVSLLLVATRGLLLVIVAGAWIAGIWLNSLLQMPQQPCLLFSGLSFLLLLIFWREQRDLLLLLVFLFIGLGAWRYAQTLPQYDPQSIEPFVGNSSSFSIQGTVVDEPKLQARTRTLTINANAIQYTGSSQWTTVDGTIEVVTLFQGSSPDDPYGANYGDSVEITGKLEPPASTSAKNIIASMAFPRIAVSNTGGDNIIAAIYRLRNQLAIVIEQALPQPDAAILIAIFLGLHTPALNLLASDFNVTGTAHLIASSGFKVTILAGLVSSPTRKLLSEKTGEFPLTPLHKSWRDWVRALLILLSIALYTILSGAGPAAQRAGIMGGLIVIAPRSGRQYNVYTGLAGAALIMTCIDPLLLWDVGFQLSFLGTLGIVLLTPYFQRLLHPLANLPAGSLIVELTTVTLAAEIATLPIVAITFQNISLIAPITNLLTVPLLGPLIISGLVVSVTGLLFHPLSLLCGWVAWPFLWYTQTVITGCSMIPDAYIPIPPGPLNNFIGWIYYALLVPASGFLLHYYPLSPTKKHPSRLTPYNRILLQVGSIVLIIVITGVIIISTPSPTNNTISFFNINVAKAHNKFIHGESIFIHTQDGKTLLIDGGGDSTTLSQLLDQQLSPWQHSLDMVILTSPEQDTMTGLQDVVTRYDVGAIFDAGMAHPTTNYARWRRTINERNLRYKPVAQGTTISLGTSIQIQVLWPQTLHSGSDEVRDNGLILRLVMPGVRLLLLGSSIQSNYALADLLASVDRNMLKSDIVQVLGDMNTSVPAVFSDVLQRAQPSVVVVTSATPGKSRKATSNTHLTLSSALASIPQTLETSQQGTLELQSNSHGWTMNK
jgi:competence protein ComEC